MMDADTRKAIDEAIRDQKSVNRNIIVLIRGLLALATLQHKQIVTVWDYLRAQVGEDDNAPKPEIPTPEQLRKQATQIDELKRMFGLEPGESQSS